jgi:hypothetical protein
MDPAENSIVGTNRRRFHEKARFVKGRRDDLLAVISVPSPLSPHFHPHSPWAHCVNPVPIGVRSRRVLPSLRQAQGRLIFGFRLLTPLFRSHLASSARHSHPNEA